MPLFLGFAVSGLFCAATPAQAETVRILVPQYLANNLAELQETLPQLEFVTGSSHAERLEKVGDCDAMVGMLNADLLQAGSNLKWIQVGSAGVEGYLSLPGLRNSDIIFTNGKIVQGPEIADHAMGLLLMLTRNLKQFNDNMREGDWNTRQTMPMIELRGKTMLIIGLGGIGLQVAERADAFGMTVLAVDPKDFPFMRALEYVGKPDELDDLLPEADVVVSSVPHTAESEGLLGEEEFERMKDGVYLINISRGPVVDTAALVDALESGKVRGAGLDVTDPEPLPSDHPLWRMPNVIITPHVASQSPAVGRRISELFRENIERFVEGRPLRNVVDKVKGY